MIPLFLSQLSLQTFILLHQEDGFTNWSATFSSRLIKITLEVFMYINPHRSFISVQTKKEYLTQKHMYVNVLSRIQLINYKNYILQSIFNCTPLTTVYLKLYTKIKECETRRNFGKKIFNFYVDSILVVSSDARKR